MKIKNLKIENFRGIKKVVLEDLKDVIVIAGPNGSGKSTIYDAIRFIKSVYGGYNDNEMDLWFNEFQIDLARKNESLKSLFRDSGKDLKIKIEITLSDEEKKYIKENGVNLLRPKVISQFLSEVYEYDPYTSIARNHRKKKRVVEREIETEKKELLANIENDVFIGELQFSPDLKLTITPNPVLECVFSSYLPKDIGVIDYNSAYRSYNRERIGGINLDAAVVDQRMSQHALYNYAGKYTNIKSEMASTYIKDLIKEKKGIAISGNSLIDTIKELFRSFFPGKEFLGPIPNVDGNLEFPIRLSTGEIHDIDELSSGEKEIVYGYLRLKNDTPHNSVLLLDEPELHLNPRLIQGLPEFYRKNLGEAMENQIWLVTHSDALLRETIGQLNYSTYHMKFADSTDENQIKKVDVTADLESAVIDLVGDLATYHPGAKVVILEGGGDSEFDLAMITSLFPKFINSVNAISGGSKNRITDLHKILSDVADKSMLPMSFFGIVDWDTEGSIKPESTQLFKWNVYHIENYLLEEKYILSAMQELSISDKTATWTIEKVTEELKKSAESSLGSLVLHKLTTEINNAMVGKISIGADPNRKSYATDLYKSLESAKERINKLSGELTESEILKKEENYRSQYKLALKTNAWRTEFKGRDILHRFVSNNIPGVKYETFRNVVINKMKSEGFQPSGMKKIIDAILSA